MKNRLILLLATLLMALSLNAKTMNKKTLDPNPDFRYPQTVSAHAQAAYDAAVKQNDYPVALQALIQYALAETSRTDSAGNDVLARCETLIDQCDRKDCQSIARHLQARILLKMSTRDYTQHDSLLLLARQRHEEAKTLAKGLSVSPRQMGEGLFRADDWGFRVIPTLYDYLLSWEVDNYQMQTCYNYDKQALYCSWLALHTADSDQGAQMYLEFLLLNYNEDDYYANKQYVSKYPDSPYANCVRQRIAIEERESVQCQYPDLVTSQDSLRATVKVDNLHDCTLTLYRIPEGIKANKNNMYQVSDLVPLTSVDVQCDDTIPFHGRELTALFPPQPYGRYLILPSFRSRDGSVRQDKVIASYMLEHQQLRVSDLAEYVVEVGSESNRLVVVDRITGAPQQGVDVRLTLYPNGRNGRWVNGKREEAIREVKQYRTEVDGILTVTPNVPFDYQLSRGDDRYLPASQCYEANEKLPQDRTQVNLFLDLAIYRPGETLQGTAIAYHIGTTRREPSAHAALKLELRDASHNLVDTLTCQTDDMGQAVFSFPIPTDRMNGEWSIHCDGNFYITQDSRTGISGYRSFQVSEYKAPTFSVDLSETAQLQQTGQPVVIRGQVNTFSGMPVADAKVELLLTRHSWWWMDDDDFEDKDMEVQTDAEGRFSYTCPAEWLPSPDQHGFRYCYIYQVKADCTDAAGESHSSTCSFRVGDACGLSMSDSEILLPARGKVKLPLTYNTTDPHPAPVRCHYVLTLVNDTTHVIREEDLSSNEVDWTKVPSGQYRFTAHVIGNPDALPAEATLTLYRENDKVVANGETLWIPNATRRVGKDGRTDILIGTATGCHVYYVSQSRTRLEGSGWLHYTPGMHHLQLPMPQGTDDYLDLTLVTIRDGKISREQFRLDAPRKDCLHLAASTFRDRVSPGQQETWTFRLTDDQGNTVPSARMLLEAYNRSLHQLAPNNWSLRTSLLEGSLYRLNVSTPSICSQPLSYQPERYDVSTPTLPYLWLYEQDFFSDRSHGRLMYANRNTRIRGMAAAQPMMMAVEDDVEIEEADMASEEIMIGYAASAPRLQEVAVAKQKARSAEEDASLDAQLSSLQLRTGDVHVALWQPRLIADAEGNITVTFDVPQQNTTWIVQALAYSQSMATDRWSGAVLAQRPLMVQPFLPRFLRQGDQSQLRAKVMNASDETQQAHVLLELFDPRTQAVLHVETLDIELQAKATEVVSIDCNTPVDAPYIGFRVRALAKDGSGDGEQQLLPIATDISPVIETHPFYLQPDEADYQQTLSQGGPEGRLTLEFCANPTWYCVTALPTLIDEEAHTSTALAHALYGLSLAETLAKSQPEIREAIDQWMQLHQSDSAAYDPLKSPLQQNADLKIGTLKASPWLSSAEWQNERMSQLQQLFDQSRNQALYDRLINRLTTLQRPDGGFAWFDYKGCESSPWTTQTVLELIGELRHLGCLTDDDRLTQMAYRAVDYLEQEAVAREKRLLREYKKSDLIYAEFEDFAYVRGLFLDQRPATNKDVQRILRKALDSMEKHWGERSLSNKAFIAITLHRQGRDKTALDIIESIRQFALTTPAKGMYWERLPDGFWYHPVAATATILQAMAEVDPRTDELNRIRQWLLLEKQTSDWGSSSLAADAIYALLSTGDDWLAPQLVSTRSTTSIGIEVDGKPVTLTPSDQYLGYVRMDLPADTRSVAIHRTTGHPAWGSLYHQYAAPMTEIKAISIPELSVTKTFYVQDAEGQWKPASSLQVGQRVQVRLSVHADKAFEFVTLHDERPALLEPVNQTSHYEYNPRVGYFLETKDRETNLYVRRLTAGNHLFTYECNVTHIGNFSSGIATIQCQYAPQFTAHSAGEWIGGKEE